MSQQYVHGYSPRENQRLQDQASTLVELLHHDTVYPAGSCVLEAGCGVGAQTVTLAANSPAASFVSVDISPQSLADAARRVADAGLSNVKFQQGDIFNLPFADATFDHAFICFVLEHLADPVAALQKIARTVKPGGSITVIEGDHGSTYFHPDSNAARKAVQCLIDLQAAAGGDSLIGRRLYPTLQQAGLADIKVSPRMVYVDGSRPEMADGFTRKTFTAMVEGVADDAIKSGMVSREEFTTGVRDLYRTAESDGVFCYTFFKAVGIRKP